MKEKKSPNYKEGLKQIGKNVAAVGVGSGLGYMGGGLLTTELLKTKRFQKYFRSLSPAKRAQLRARLRYGSAAAGTLAGGISGYAMNRALEKEQEKSAAVFTNFALDNLV